MYLWKPVNGRLVKKALCTLLYYYCQKKGCEQRGKSIKREVLHNEFEAILKRMTPSMELIKVASERKITQMLDRIVEIEEPTVLARFEQKIKLPEDEKIVIEEKIKHCGRPMKSFDGSYRTAMKFLANPYSLWASGQLENQQAVLKLAFADRLTYVRGEGYRTANITLPFKVLEGFSEENQEMVGRAGFEPATNWLKAPL